ncbi:hypothetical protein [Actinotalea sp.]|uniref:hypothetical protein n=1 Tax=Actinotalea sp. TaxID=1872145 RepID=UPI003569F5D8
MATFSSVKQQHVLQAIGEYDSRGSAEFLALYGFEPTPGYPLVHEGREYDSMAILGVAHRYATGRLAPPAEFHEGPQGAAALLRKRGFEVVGPTVAPAPTRARATRAPRATVPRTPAVRAAAAREYVPAICPTCSMALPATGRCDNCD